jgi:hypothetical protein
MTGRSTENDAAGGFTVALFWKVKLPWCSAAFRRRSSSIAASA